MLSNNHKKEKIEYFHHHHTFKNSAYKSEWKSLIPETNGSDPFHLYKAFFGFTMNYSVFTCESKSTFPVALLRLDKVLVSGEI